MFLGNERSGDPKASAKRPTQGSTMNYSDNNPVQPQPRQRTPTKSGKMPQLIILNKANFYVQVPVLQFSRQVKPLGHCNMFVIRLPGHTDASMMGDCVKFTKVKFLSIL